MNLQAIDTWAETHHGVVTIDAALDAGISRSSWHRAIRNGSLVQLHPGVCRMNGTPRTHEQTIMAAVFAGGDRAVASHRSAARLWGIERPTTDPVDITMARGRRQVRLDGVVAHRPTDRIDFGIVTRAGIPTTNPLRTVADLCAVDPDAAPAGVEFLIVSGFARPSGLRQLVRRHSRSGRTGEVALRAAVEAWPLGDKPADSVLEPAMARLLAEHRLPPATFHARIAGIEVDFHLIGTPVVIECDGWEFHVKDRAGFGRDRERDAVLAAEGYVVVRVTWEHVMRRPAHTARRIEAVLRRWAPEALIA